MEIIERFRSYLKDFDYPNIDFLDDAQVADQFIPANRKIMVKWLVHALSAKIVLPSDWNSAANMIADYFCENGFCTSAQKSLFVMGDTKLSMNDELVIFERIFDYLLNRNGAQNASIAPQAIHSHVKADLNLFPTLGYPEHFTPNEYTRKITEYKANIAQLEDEIQELSQAEISEIPEIKEVPMVKLEGFESNTIKLANFVATLKENPKGLAGFKPGILKGCSSPLEIIQYLHNLKVEFPRQNKDWQTGTDDLGLRNANLAFELVKYLQPEL